MNSVNLMGRPTKDPAIHGDGDKKMAMYTLAVNAGKDKADFISCKCFGRAADFAEKYVRKGEMIGVTGSIRTGSYTNREGAKAYTTDVVVYSHHFAGGRGAKPQEGQDAPKDADDFMDVPDTLDEELPF